MRDIGVCGCQSREREGFDPKDEGGGFRGNVARYFVRLKMVAFKEGEV